MKPTAADAKAVPALVERFERALGPAVTTPEFVTETSGRRGRASYRVWRWDCPCCSDSDLDRQWRPLFIDSDGRGPRHPPGRPRRAAGRDPPR